MNVLVVAGGTGGHFYPGLAVAKELVKSGNKIHFLVRHDDVVIPLVKNDGFAYSEIFAVGFKRRLSLTNLFAIIKLFIGTIQSFFVLLRVRPQVILAMGGYLSVPPALIAKIFGIPVVLHEQNVKPGVANRLVSRWAAQVAVAFEESRPYFSRDVVVTGNPIRPEFLSLPDRTESLKFFSLKPSKKTLLVFGGSLGAHKLNDLVAQALAELPEFIQSWQVLHITGPSDEERVRSVYTGSEYDHYIAGYCHNMAAAYSAADAVICRAGASTVSELSVLKKPALLVPFPFSSENHQWANALVLKDKGVALVYEEAELAAGKMTPVLKDFLSSNRSVGVASITHQNAAKTCATVVQGAVRTPISPK